MPTLIELSPETRGDVPAEVTHLVEVFPKAGEYFVGYCFSRDLGWWFENDADADGPETEEFLQQYRYGRPAEPHELPTRAEASPSVGRDHLHPQVRRLLEQLRGAVNHFPDGQWTLHETESAVHELCHLLLDFGDGYLAKPSVGRDELVARDEMIATLVTVCLEGLVSLREMSDRFYETFVHNRVIDKELTGILDRSTVAMDKASAALAAAGKGE